MTLQEAILTRRSTRTFTDRPLSDDVLNGLLPDGATHLYPVSVESLAGSRIGTYGVIKGRPAYIAVAWDRSRPQDALHAGMEGERAVLAATCAGLGTVWLGGTFDRKKTLARIPVLPANSEIGCVIAVGEAAQRPGMVDRLMRRVVHAASRRPLEDLVIGGQIPDLTRPGLEAARLAPSARNRQPWRFVCRPDGSLDLFGDPSDGIFTALDCGIALAHFLIATPDFRLASPRGSHPTLIPLASIIPK